MFEGREEAVAVKYKDSIIVYGGCFLEKECLNKIS